jgi:hypothetical protein
VTHTRIVNWLGPEGFANSPQNIALCYGVFKAKNMLEHRLIAEMIRFAKFNFDDCRSFRMFAAEYLRKHFICYGVVSTGMFPAAPLGYALWSRDGENMVLRQMAITYPAYRRCGIGWKLWQTCLEDLAVDVSHVIIESPSPAFCNWMACHGLADSHADGTITTKKDGVQVASYG